MVLSASSCSKKFMLVVRDLVRSITGSEAGLTPRKCGDFFITQSCQNAERLGDYLYADSAEETRCSRKYNRFMELKASKGSVQVKRRTGPPLVTPESLEAMTILYKGGASCPEIGKRFGLSHTFVSRTLKNSGVTLRPKGRVVGKQYPHQMSADI